MIVAIMQPYFFPYIGYFQLMAAVDAFVFLDDVQYVERGWMNRNRIRRGGRSEWLSMPVQKSPRNTTINERRYVLGNTQAVIASRVREAYGAAPAYRAVARVVLDTVNFNEPNVARFNANLLQVILGQFGAGSRLLFASDVRGARREAGQAGILQLCRQLGATRYVNAIGGGSLYEEAAFTDAGVELRFLRTRVPPVELADGPEHLSIIDGLMHLGVEGCKALLPDYELLSPAEARALS